MFRVSYGRPRWRFWWPRKRKYPTSLHPRFCKHCGLEFETYREIKSSLARRMPEVDPDAVERLRAFGARIAGETQGP